MKFDSVRDEILSMMANESWANASSGDVESPSGWFARISNDVADIVSIIDAFAKEAFEIDPNFDMSELVGHFLIVENDQGFVFVTEYPNELAVINAYNNLELMYAEWNDGE